MATQITKTGVVNENSLTITVTALASRNKAVYATSKKVSTTSSPLSHPNFRGGSSLWSSMHHIAWEQETAQ